MVELTNGCICRAVEDDFSPAIAARAIHLSVHALDRLVADLAPHYGADCPAAVVYRASWPDQRIVCGALADIVGQAKAAAIERSALILVGRALAAKGFVESALCSPACVRRFRGGGGSETAP